MRGAVTFPTKRHAIAKPLIWSATILFLCVSACLILYTVKLWFTESLWSRRGSFAFLVTISEPVIREFPTLEVIGEPQYHSGWGDGPKLPDQAIFYRSRLPVAELLAQSQRYVTSCGYSPGTAHHFPGVSYASNAKTLYLNVETTDDGVTQLHAQVLFNIYE